MTDKRYTNGEELANTITHAIGVIFGLIVGVILINMAVKTSDIWAIVSVSIYVACMILSYITSTLYHSASNQRNKAILRKYDHAAIYLHIAGTYTPFTLFVLREAGIWGWMLTIIIWMAGIAGTTLSFIHKKTGSKLETICYVLMGCVILIAMKPLIDTLTLANSMDAFYWLIGGGISYILGAILYSFKKIRYMHSVFHLFVLGGTVCHVLAIASIFE